MGSKVSIIMGIYNIQSKEVLKKSIDSILKQTYKNIEFIIIDDGSTNDTFSWAQQFTQDDDRVMLKKNKNNLGLTKTLNIALSFATGEYIARMDGDDYCSYDRIEKQIRYLENNKEVDLVACNMSLFDEKGIWGEKKSNEIITKNDFLFTSPLHHPTILTYRWCFEKVKGYKEKWYTSRNEDYDMFMRMYASDIKMCVMQEKLYFYREDVACYHRRKYRYRICEFVVRLKGFYQLNLYPKAILYVIKPLIVGIVPQKILKILRKLKT